MRLNHSSVSVLATTGILGLIQAENQSDFNQEPAEVNSCFLENLLTGDDEVPVIASNYLGRFIIL